MYNDNISVEDFINGAIIEGYQVGTQSFLQNLEEQLQISNVIAESGDAHELLQHMIDETDGATSTYESYEQLDNIGNKLSRIL